MNLLGILLIIFGGVFLWSAVKGKSPVEIIRTAIMGTSTTEVKN